MGLLGKTIAEGLRGQLQTRGLIQVTHTLRQPSVRRRQGKLKAIGGMSRGDHPALELKGEDLSGDQQASLQPCYTSGPMCLQHTKMTLGIPRWSNTTSPLDKCHPELRKLLKEMVGNKVVQESSSL